jgi:capping protein beta
MSQSAMKNCLNVLRRTSPHDVEDNLERLGALRPDLDEELWQRVDTPLQTQVDPESQKEYVLCDYNRDGDSYRSPWTNKYYPPLDDGDEGFRPSQQLRNLEIECNAVFDVYRHLYFEGGVSSVYMWDLEQRDGFAACFCVQKEAKSDEHGLTGYWSSVHVFEVVKAQGQDTYDYRLTSTALVSIPIESKVIGEVNLAGSITKQTEKQLKLKRLGDSIESHAEKMGPMLEDLELELRTTIEGVYFQKTIEIVNGMRVTDPEFKNREKKMANMAQQAAKNKT